MKNSNDATAQTVISLISSSVCGDKKLMLFRARINGARKNIIYACCGAEEDFCTVNMNNEESRRFFDALCECDISPEHLADVIEDACREQYL